MAKGLTKGKKGGKTSKGVEKKRNPLFETKARNFRVGGDIQPKRDLTRFVRWPKYIILQRQKRILLSRLKVPPQIHQFTATLDKNQSSNLFKLLKKYSPETATEKKQRQTEAAANKAKDQKQADTKKPVVLKFGLNHITQLVENKQAKLVVIAHDVDPIELVLWLPQLCRKQEIPFCFVKGKAALGKLVHQKTATAVALTDVKPEDKSLLDTFQKNFRAQFVENAELRRKWGGGKLGIKSQHQIDAHQRAVEKEALKKANL